ncbi:hypothetical protein NFI96_020192 [Prochilodus magdalenae]|nr:hypothetical protein NFI96_020192 [Prochilodus magdalenae]
MTASRPSASAKEERKLRKPLIERKRRERINHCLDQLRETVVGAFKLDQSKLEKADILEMTVKHLQNIQSSRVQEPVLDSEAQHRYSTGYIKCIHEVHNLLLSCDWMDKTLGSRLLNHLLKLLPKSSAECSGRPKPGPLEQDDNICYNGNRENCQGSCPASPVQGNSSPHHANSPELTTLEMWRPW